MTGNPAALLRLTGARPMDLLLSVGVEPDAAMDLAATCTDLSSAKGEQRVPFDCTHLRWKIVEASALGAIQAARWRDHFDDHLAVVFPIGAGEPTHVAPEVVANVGSCLAGWDGLEVVFNTPEGDFVAATIIPPEHLMALAVFGPGPEQAKVERLLALDRRDPPLAAGCLGSDHPEIAPRPRSGKAFSPHSVATLLSGGSADLREFVSLSLRDLRVP